MRVSITMQQGKPRIFDGIMKGLRASKEARSTDSVEGSKSLLSALDNVFSGSKTDTSADTKDTGKVVELNIGQLISSFCVLAPPILPSLSEFVSLPFR